MALVNLILSLFSSVVRRILSARKELKSVIAVVLKTLGRVIFLTYGRFLNILAIFSSGPVEIL